MIFGRDPNRTATAEWYGIHRLLYRYIACVDAADAAGTADLFVPHGSLVSHVMGTTCFGRQAIHDYIGSLRNSWRAIRIHLALPDVSILDEQSAVSSAYFTVYGAGGADHWGLYTDRFLNAEGGWLFERREISLKGAAPDSQRMAHR